MDVMQQLRAESVLPAEKRMLKMIARGASLTHVLDDLCDSIDAHAPDINFNRPTDGCRRQRTVARRRLSTECAE